ncbi:MAG TPA: septum formation initiator family protein [Oligoflexia bacterium]|nr:septum formation initiator family protein [Oligoflexia bacterium]
MIAFFTVFGNHGLLRLVNIQHSLLTLRGQNNELESEIVETKNKIYAIRHSDFALEKASREQLGLSKPGEIVYIFPQSEQAAPDKQ